MEHFQEQNWVLQFRHGQMDKKITLNCGIFLLVLLSLNMISAVITGSETMTRNLPNTTFLPNSTFTLTYSVIGASGTWGATIQDNITGGCLFPSGKNQYKSVMLSDDGISKSVIISTPNINGTCMLIGDYQFGSTTIKNFNNIIINVCAPICVRPINLCQITSSNGCGGNCNWNVIKKTIVDTNCDNTVSRTELGVGINDWIAGTLTRENLGASIQAWANG